MKNIYSIDKSLPKNQAKVTVNQGQMPKIPFDNFFETALNVNAKEPKPIEHNFNQKPSLKLDPESEVLAQAVNPNEIERVFRQVQERRRQEGQADAIAEEENYLGTQRFEITPFQMFIDKAVEVLESISELDFRVNDLTEQFAQGKVSIDEVSMEMTKLNLAISFATTVLSTASQTFKEIYQIAI